MMNFSLSYKIVLIFITAIMLLAIVSYFYFSSTEAFIQSSAKVQHSQKIINQLEVVLSLIKDAETGQRGFIITKNETFLSPYDSASMHLDHEMLTLSELMIDSVQMRRYESLVPDISAMMARLDFSIDLIRRNEFDSAISYIVSTTGKRYMDKVRSTIQTMKDDEKAKLTTLVETEEENARHTFMSVIIGSALTSILLVVGLIRILHEIMKKKSAEAALRHANKELIAAQWDLKKINNELEERVKERTKALAISEKRHRSLITATTSIVWTCNAEGQIEKRVPLWEKFTGQQWEQYKGFGWLEAIHPDDREKIKRKWKETKNKQTILKLESRLLSTSGNYRHILLHGVPIISEDGRMQELIGTISDIDDQKRAEEVLMSNNKELEEAYRNVEIINNKLKNSKDVLETFVYAAAHDLRSPVVNLKSLLTFIHKTKDINKKFELFARFEEAVHRLDNTISGLGEIIEMQEADNSTAKVIYFQDILDQILAEYSHKVIATDAKIDASFESCPSIIYLESYLTSIMTNMVTNALKYHKEGQSPQLFIRAEKEGDIVILTFRDEGIGMDLERYGKNLFKPFKRFTTQAEGKGIGLHIIKSMMEKNGGRIELDSELGRGTTFRCYLREYQMSSAIRKEV